MPEVKFSIAAVAAVVGFVLSLVLEKVPRLKKAWADASNKAVILFAGFEGITLAWWALGCWGGIGIPATDIPCGLVGLGQAVLIGAFGFAGTQTGFATVARYTPNAQQREAKRAADGAGQ